MTEQSQEVLRKLAAGELYRQPTLDEMYQQQQAQKPLNRLEKPYNGPFPRCKHTHRCTNCGDGSNCYKAKCNKPQRVPRCQWCPREK